MGLLDHYLCWPTTGLWVAMREYLKMASRNQGLKSGERKRLLLFHNPLILCTHPQNTLSFCCCSPLASVDVLKHLDANFNEPKSLRQIRNHGPFLRLSLGFLTFSKGALLPNFNRMVERQILSWDTSNSKTSSASYLRICTFGLTQWFPKCAPWNPRDPRPVPRGSVNTFL